MKGGRWGGARGAADGAGREGRGERKMGGRPFKQGRGTPRGEAVECLRQTAGFSDRHRVFETDT